jgi:isopenicillin-N N-acyltransferase like protein
MQALPKKHILELSGTPRQRGRIHGEVLKNEIHELLALWKEFLVAENKLDPGEYIRDFLQHTDFIPAINKWTPGLLEEVRGTAEAAGVDYAGLFAFQLQDEQWWYGRQLNTKKLAEPPGCSSIGWQGNEHAPVLVAQNMDLPAYMDGFQVVLRIVDEQKQSEALVFSVAGLVALNGMNSRSIGVVCNNLPQVNHSRAGLPVAFVLRGVLERKSFSNARAFLEKVPHASGQNYMLGGNRRIVDLECSANQVREVTLNKSRLFLCHTNHPLLNTDHSEEMANFHPGCDKLAEFAQKYYLNSHLRLQALVRQSHVMEREGIDIHSARELLSSHESSTAPVCRHKQKRTPWMTVGTSIMVLDTEPRLHVLPGPPCSSLVTEFSCPSRGRRKPA